jgi:amino acid adenylation domain-containing protein/non-ribosomal peptide synthase protein (TIGR01720 family)
MTSLPLEEIARQVENLSPERRKLFIQLLDRQGIDISDFFILPQAEERSTFPLSFAQRRLWFLDQFEPNTALYNIPLALRLDGALDVATLQRTLSEIVRRHKALRTSFSAQDGEPYQVVSPEYTVPLPVVDLRPVACDVREAEALRVANEEARRPFDLSHGPLLRAQLLRLDDQQHIALLTMHHIVADGWSAGVLVREVAELYTAYVQGRRSPLQELSIQYTDFACWQEEHQRKRWQSQLDYWREKLADCPLLLDLPTDRPRPPALTYRGAAASLHVPTDLADKLRALSQQEGASLFMTLLAAFQTLLYRHSGQDDVPIGTPIANRNRRQTEGLIGFFVNTLVLRSRLAGQGNDGMSFRSLLQQVRDTALGAYDHQDLPFEVLVEELRPERSPSHTPLFQVMFVLQNGPAGSLQLPQLTITPLDTHSGVAKFDLTLTMWEEPPSTGGPQSAGGLGGTIEYNTDLFDAATITRLLAHFTTLLHGIAADPDALLYALPLLTEAEREQLVVTWNSNRADYPQDRCIHEMLEAQVERTPDALAVIYRETGGGSVDSLTFRELNRRANQIARYLRRLGAGPEVLVGLAATRSTEMIVGLLGILKAGSAYLPLDPAYPHERLSFMMRDAGLELLVTQGHLRSTLPETGCRIVCLDADRELFERESGANLGSDACPGSLPGPRNLAYVIYTSGSTGKPKGVMIQHNTVLNLWAGLNQAIYDGDGGAAQGRQSLRVSLNAPLSFDASVQQLVMLLRGHTLHIIPDDVRRDGESLLAYVRENKLDVLDCVPSQLKVLLAAGLLDGDGWVPGIVLPGGEAIDQATWDVLTQARETQFHNMYGPTECTVDATTCCVNRVGKRPTIGRPMANRAALILDEHRGLVPIGVIGELYIGGDGVGRGYLNRPQLTEERFVPDPFGEAMHPMARPNARMYKTGDLARYLPDGNIEFLGRNDYQVKVRGFRIELGEIGAVLEQHPGVAQAVVIAREDTPGDKRLVAYMVTTENGDAPSAGTLQAYLQTKLPSYMVPAALVFLDAIPMTPNGKVDRRALPAPEWGAASKVSVPPRTPIEGILVELWKRVLGVEQVGTRDSFFDLGGHSLLATQLVSRIRQVLQVELPLRELFERPTVAELGERIEAILREAQGLARPPIEPVARVGLSTAPNEELPLSFAQQRMWFLDQLEPDTALYNIPMAVRFTGHLDTAALQRALGQLAQRHEALRTTFPTVDGTPRQVISPASPTAVLVDDLTPLPPEEREKEALRLAREEAQQPFDLGRGPLLRVKLLRLEDGDHITLFTMHHIISDGWSSGVLLRELSALYAAEVTGQNANLPPLTVQYGDYASWQRKWLQGEVLEKQLSYWKDRLRATPPLLELPTDRPRPSMPSWRGGHVSFTMPGQLGKAIADASRREGVTLFMTLLAAFQTLLYRYSGQEDIAVGTPIANRNHAEIEGLIGFFVNTLVLRTDLSGDPTFRELLRRVRETALGAFMHQDLPFEMVVDAVQPQRDTSHSPLFQVMFVLQTQDLQQNAFRADSLLPELSATPMDVELPISKFDLTLVMSEEKDGFRGSLEYSQDLFEEETIRRMLGHLQVLLGGIVADPDQHVSRLPILTEAERQQLLVQWNDTALDAWADRLADGAACPGPRKVDSGLCIHQWVTQQVERTPEAMALTWVFEGGTRSLTYRELDARANCLAHYLRKRGVGPEVLVGLCVERSLELIIGMLGVLKAGGAYVPLDPAYPQERLAFLLQDSAAAVLLTQGDLVGRLPPYEGEVICLDRDWESIAQASDSLAQDGSQVPESGVGPDNLAYVIYTSGSTGKPKGTLLQHRSLCNVTQAFQMVLDVRPGDRVLQFFSPSFDGSLVEIFPTLVTGGTLFLARRDVLSSPTDLWSLLRDQAINISIMAPAMWAVLPTEDLPALRVGCSGGEALPTEVAAHWAVGRRFVNAYGPTEATVAVATYRIPEAFTNAGSVPIGRPVLNTTMYLLDVHGQPVPIGVPGELHIGGIQVARGYLNRPDLTAEKFIADPFNSARGARLYRSGDLARYLPDGNIEFLGRIDQQVKIRGFRIELGEIEAILEQHPGVQQAVAMALPTFRGPEDAPGQKQLVAYIVATQEHSPTTTELRNWLQGRLPSYMVPAVFVFLPSLPVTPAGKVDRRALPAPEASRPELAAGYVAPRTPVEQTLAAIWEQLLGVKQVGVQDNFFELGGDSILSIQVIAKANQAGLRLSPKHLFQAPTVAGLAALAQVGTAPMAEQGVVEGPVPLTPIQHWFFEQKLVEPWHWNQAMLLQVHHSLQPDVLREAVHALLRHHDALRLRFGGSGDETKQVNGPLDDSVSSEFRDISSLSDEEQRSAIEEEASACQGSLNLATGPLFRVIYWSLGPGKGGRLLLVGHHLVIDGVSWRILLEDLQTAYSQLEQSQQLALPAKTTSYQEWAKRLQSYAQSAPLREELPYWGSVMSGGRGLLPPDYPGGENTVASARTVDVSLSQKETEDLLQRVPEVYHTEINDVLLTALAQTISGWNGEREVLVDLEGHGREDLFEGIDISRTVGWFTSLYPVRLVVKQRASAPSRGGQGELLKAVKEQLRKVPRRGIGYGVLRYLSEEHEIRESLRGEVGLSFNYLGQVDQLLAKATEQSLPGQGLPAQPDQVVGQESSWSIAEESSGMAQSPQGQRTHQIEINGVVAGGRLRLALTYSGNLYRRETVEGLANRYLEDLRGLISHCLSPEAGGHTPSDFALAGLEQRKLDQIIGRSSRSKGKATR